MIFRHVVDVTNSVDDATAIAQTGDQYIDKTAAMHIEDDASDKILEWRASGDTPGIFKRVRFLTQWYDAEDSKGKLYLKVGKLKFWNFTSSASAYRKQLLTMSTEAILEHRPGNAFWSMFF